MTHTVIAAVGDNMESLFVGVREFPTKKIILLADESHLKKAEETKKELEKFKIPVDIKKVKGEPWETTFEAVKDIKEAEGEQNLIINAATGVAGAHKCALCSAAFVNGLKAFTVHGNEINIMPILKFSYYKILTDKKMDILKFLYNNKECCASLDELSKKLKMSLPLISYHINGNLKSEGLKEMGLVMADEWKGRVKISLTLLGKLLVKGYVK
ncbi:MAG: winged helix-turn-helix domain-containing protein [Nanoarchaeota archaeon]